VVTFKKRKLFGVGARKELGYFGKAFQIWEVGWGWLKGKRGNLGSFFLQGQKALAKFLLVKIL